MQEVSIGLQRLPRPLGTTKENCALVRGTAKARPVTCPAASGLLMEVTSPASELEEEGVGVGASPAGPLPQLSWANSRELWAEMRAKDATKTAPEVDLLTLHPGILPSMRTILLDWLMEVCVCVCVCVSVSTTLYAPECLVCQCLCQFV